MKMIVGLGNPGMEYAVTRHNCGFLTIDKLIYDLNGTKEKKQANALVSQAMHQGQKLLLVKPQSYMNASGYPVVSLMNYYKLDLEDLLIIFDDMDIEPATIRLRRNGRDGGHNGIKSIIEQAGSAEIARLKIGIGHGFKGGANYVLGRFSEEEMPIMAETFAKAAEAAKLWAIKGITEAMNEYNRK